MREIPDANDDLDVKETVYKPDWVLFAKGYSMLTVIGTLELKLAHKRNPGCVSDYVKLAKEMKLVLHQLIHLGVSRPVASGILVQGTPDNSTIGQFFLYCSGSQCETFVMDLAYDGVYRFIKLSKADLCLSFQQLPLFPYFFRDMMRLRVW